MSKHIDNLTFSVQPGEDDDSVKVTVTSFGEPWVQRVGCADVYMGRLTRNTPGGVSGIFVKILEIERDDIYDTLPDSLYVSDDEDTTEAVYEEASGQVEVQFAARIVSCVNALAGIPSDVLASPEFAAALEMFKGVKS